MRVCRLTAATLIEDRYGCARDNRSRFVVHIAAEVASVGLALHQDATGQAEAPERFPAGVPGTERKRKGIRKFQFQKVTDLII